MDTFPSVPFCIHMNEQFWKYRPMDNWLTKKVGNKWEHLQTTSPQNQHQIFRDGNLPPPPKKKNQKKTPTVKVSLKRPDQARSAVPALRTTIS